MPSAPGVPTPVGTEVGDYVGCLELTELPCCFESLLSEDYWCERIAAGAT